MGLTDYELMKRLHQIIEELRSTEQGITQDEAKRLLFYGLYHNEHFDRHGVYDIDENCCEVKPHSKERNLTDQELLKKLLTFLAKLRDEGKITKDDFDRIFFYSMYHNEWFERGDLSEWD